MSTRTRRLALLAPLLALAGCLTAPVPQTVVHLQYVPGPIWIILGMHVYNWQGPITVSGVTSYPGEVLYVELRDPAGNSCERTNLVTSAGDALSDPPGTYAFNGTVTISTPSPRLASLKVCGQVSGCHSEHVGGVNLDHIPVILQAG